MGERPPFDDLLAWNADGTRMPYKMHSEYLRSMFLNDDLAEGRFKVRGEIVAIEDIKVPIFAVGTEADHVAPWRSVFKIHLLSPAEVTFVLTSGGHNAGIVSEPVQSGRSFRLATRTVGEPYRDPDRWLADQGSWWPEWEAWLTTRSGECVAPPRMGARDHGYPPLEAAPGIYVLQA
jgi:polyhydroxyalkanoate synthase